MKINIFLSVISLLLSAIFTYLVYIACPEAYNNIVLLCISSFVTFVSTLMFALGVSYDDTKQGINIRILSFVFIMIFLAINLVFAFISVGNSTIVISDSLLLTIYILLLYLLTKTKV